MADRAIPDSRRQRRREQTIAEILDAAVQAMADDGVAGMSLSDVARRVGIRPPSLYEYFPNKLAIYDALFRAGFEEMNAFVRQAVSDAEAYPLEALRQGYPAAVRWCVEHPVQAQLMFWRPVPGFSPSPTSFEPSVDQVNDLRTVVGWAVERGQLRPEALSEDAGQLYAVVFSGVITEQLANDPDGGFADGRYSRLAAEALEMWICRYSPHRKPGRAGREGSNQ
jgi:AcrR family transcriptional regulator